MIGSDTEYFLSGGDGWWPMLYFIFQGECSPGDWELTFRYVKNVIFIWCSEIVLNLHPDHAWCDLWLQVINIIKRINFDS